MSMHIETRNRRAFELVTEALRDIDLYKQLKERKQLQKAESKLEEARSEDPLYLRAHYYSGITKDLMGKATDAIEDFEKVVRENPPFISEVRYNLGVAYYHRYDLESLQKAQEQFELVLRSTEEPVLKTLAQAVLAQAGAMLILHQVNLMLQAKRGGQEEEARKHEGEAQKHFEDVTSRCEQVLASLRDFRDLDGETADEIRWTAHNARGMALMYHTDGFGSKEEKAARLREALGELEAADKYSPQNWANYCDLGSAHMRLGYWLNDQSEFEQALKYLEEVVSDLRPDYGFALYEIGRVRRLKGEFGRAVEYFEKSKQIPYGYRDVSDRRLDREIARADAEDATFP
jgi:tetratricopeptide (TPR) repeat protein